MNTIFLAHSDGTYLHYLETVFKRNAAKLYQISGTSQNGIESLKILLEHKPNVALLGADLPYLTGVDIAKILDRKERDTRSILVFPKQRRELFTEIFLHGVDGILHKGDDAPTVLRGVEEVLSGNSYTSSTFF